MIQKDLPGEMAFKSVKKGEEEGWQGKDLGLAGANYYT